MMAFKNKHPVSPGEDAMDNCGRTSPWTKLKTEVKEI